MSISLEQIRFKAKEIGDVDEEETIGTPSEQGISLGQIKYRASQVEDD